jgi:hypothetical protein
MLILQVNFQFGIFVAEFSRVCDLGVDRRARGAILEWGNLIAHRYVQFVLYSTVHTCMRNARARARAPSIQGHMIRGRSVVVARDGAAGHNAPTYQHNSTRPSAPAVAAQR